MGAGTSVHSSIEGNRPLQEFVSTQSYPYASPLWNRLLNSNINFAQLNMFEIQASLDTLWSKLAENNPQSRNFEQLIYHIIDDLQQFTPKNTLSERTCLINQTCFYENNSFMDC